MLNYFGFGFIEGLDIEEEIGEYKGYLLIALLGIAMISLLAVYILIYCWICGQDTASNRYKLVYAMNLLLLIEVYLFIATPVYMVYVFGVEDGMHDAAHNWMYIILVMAVTLFWRYVFVQYYEEMR